MRVATLDREQKSSKPSKRLFRRRERIPFIEDPQHFAHGFSFYKLFWIFFIGCILGVVVETLWCLVTRGHYENRVGLVWGPFNLVYGFGALFMSLGLHWAEKKRDGIVFLGGVLIGSVYEYLCSWIQEQMFGSVSWQYDNLPFNLHGRINLLYSMFWGILALIWVKDLQPMMCRWIAKIPNRYGKPLTWALVAFMIVNTAVSGLAVGRWSQRVDGLGPQDSLAAALDRHFPDERLSRIYPNMVFVKVQQPAA